MKSNEHRMSYWLRVVFEKMDIQSTHESSSSGWHVFETNANRFALSSQVHGTKPIDNCCGLIKTDTVIRVIRIDRGGVHNARETTHL